MHPRHMALLLVVLSALTVRAAELDSAQAALDHAANAVAVVRVERGTESSHGSAVLVRLEAGHADLVTCFHVLEGASGPPRVVLGSRGAIHVDDAPIAVAGFPDLDLAVLRVPLRRGAGLGRPLALRDPPPRGPEPVHAIAYPGYAGGASLFGVPLLAQGARNAGYVLETLGLRPGERPGALPRAFDVAFLTGTTVAPGMSGGPVIGADGQVVGLVWARLPDVGLMIPAASVSAALKRAGGDVEFVPFEPRAFELPRDHWLRSPALQAARRAPAVAEDVVEWGGLEGIIAAVDEPDVFRRRFQEVDLVAAITSGAPVHVRLPRAEVGTPIVRAWLNGHQEVLVGPGAAWRVDDKLLPGENLLMLQVGSSGEPRGPLELRSALRSRRLDVDLCDEAAPFFRLRRSLPAVVAGFAVFVTIRTPAPPQAPPKGAVRMALRLDEAERAVRARLPITVPLRSTERTSGALTLQAVELLPASGTAVVVSLHGALKLERVALSGLEARLPAIDVPWPLHLRVRATVVRRTDQPGLALSVRVVEARLGRPLALPVIRGSGGLEVDLDVTAMLEAAILGWVNNVLLGSDPRALDGPALLGLLAKADPDVALRASDLRVVEGRWLVATLDHAGCEGLDLGPLPDGDEFAGEVVFAPTARRAELYGALAGAPLQDPLKLLDPAQRHVARISAEPAADPPAREAAAEDPWSDLVGSLRRALRAEALGRRWCIDVGGVKAWVTPGP